MRLATTAALTAAALVATSGAAVAAPDVSATDRAAITKVIKTLESTADSATICALLTSSLIKKEFGSRKQCEAQPHGTATSFRVSGISVSGDSATAKITEHGDDAATGTWHFRRSSSTWKLSLVEADYYRSGFRSSFGSKYKSAGATIDPLDNKKYRACGLAGLLDRSDKAFLALVYELGTSRNKTFGQVFSRCSSKAPGGKSPFRKVFEYELRAGAKGAPAGVADCVVSKLRATISEPTLINEYMDSAGSLGNEKLYQAISTAGSACNKSGGSSGIHAPKNIVRPHPVH
jgi:hypothetical protein